MDTFNSEELLRLYCGGSDAAAAELFERYVERLISLARNRIAAKLRRRIDPEDVVQSAYRSFFLHAGDGQYKLNRTGDLWKLLAAITLHKLHRQVEKHTARRRHIDCEDTASSHALAEQTPSPAEVISALEQLSFVFRKLTAEEGRVLQAYLQGQSNEQIAKLLQKSPRTIRRILDQLRGLFESELHKSLRNDPHSLASQVRLSNSFPLLSWENYTLEKLVGCGGMGKVYRATAKDSGKVVALKTLHKAKLADARAMKQFVQEAELLAGLHHPNIIRLHGIGRFPNGAFFMVMDFLAAGDLQSRVDKDGCLTPRDAAECVKLVAEAVDFAHKHGILHCDLKPANILMSDTGIPIVSDFGFAQLASLDQALRLTSIGGTRGYLAPEVQKGARPSVAADVYGLGALLWALVFGEPPTAHVLVLRHEGAEQIAQVCRECVALEPSERIGTAKEVAHELATLIGAL